MLYGTISTNGPIVGIVYNDNQFIKLAMRSLASQVIDKDKIEFVIENHQAIVLKVVERKKQPFIAVVSKITPKTIYIHLPILSPCSSIPVNIDVSSFHIGDRVVGWIDINGCRILDRYDTNKDMIESYYSELSKIDIYSILYDISSNENIKINTEYKDLTHLQTFHIDPSGCVDIDDFMSIDISNQKIYIHIIDISKYITQGSIDDKLGILYGYTWYFPDFVLHLYPNTKSIYDSPTIYCITMEITFVEDIFHVELYKSKIQIYHDFNYSEVQEIFDGKDHPLKSSLDWSLSKIRDIYLPNESPTRRLYWTGLKSKINIEYESELLAHRYINGWMVFYNSWFADNIRIATESQIPGGSRFAYHQQLLPQRHHPVANVHKIIEIDNAPKEVQHILYVKQFRQAEYTNKAGHFGLNRNFYTHATSPLRRYFDRWIQYMYSYDFWTPGEVLIQHLNDMEKLNERLSEWYHKQILFEYIEQNKDKLWESYVIKIHPKGIEYYIYDIQEFIYHFHNDKQLGDKVFLKLSIDRKAIPKLVII
jgi:exoribonuclease R